MRHRDIEAARLIRATEKMNREIREVRNRQNKALAEMAAKEHEDFVDEIFADETYSNTGNTIRSWVKTDPWAVDEYVEIHKAEKELEKLGKPTDPLWIRWMKEVRNVREKNHFRRHSGKPLRPFPKPPERKKK